MPEDQDIASLKIDRGDESGRSFPVGATLLLIAVVLIIGGGGWWLLGRERPAEVTTATAREVRLDQPTTVLNASGYVEVRRVATVSFTVDAR